MPRLTKTQAAEFAELRAQGWGYVRLARRFGMSVAGARWRCRSIVVAPPTAPTRPTTGRERGLSRYDGFPTANGCKVSISDRHGIRADRAAGMTIKAVARKYGRQEKTVRRVLGTNPSDGDGRTHVHYLLRRGQRDALFEEALCRLTPGFRRYVELANVRDSNAPTGRGRK